MADRKNRLATVAAFSLILATIVFTRTVSAKELPPAFRVTELSQEQRLLMQKHSWRQGCPVPLDDLAHVSVSYWGYDETVRQGELIVHKKLAQEVLAIFTELFAARFPIEKIRLIDRYEGDDEDSMSDNNTSGFNCRMSAARNNVFSKHSYGIAIDINPLVNPYAKNGKVLPAEAVRYLDREFPVKGMIRKGESCHTAFIKRGWTWGGSWKSLKDYQHFEKKISLAQ